VGNIKIKKIKDEPIGKLVRPLRLYRGFIFPMNVKLNENFTSWFTNSIKMQCLFQAPVDLNHSYKQYLKNSKKDFLKQFKELSLEDSINDLNILHGYTAEITGFIYYHNREYHICKTKKEESAMIHKSKRSSNFNISFAIVKLYKNVDLAKKKGLNEWIYHSLESFELIYSIKELVCLDYILNLEAVKPGETLKTRKQEYIVINIEQNKKYNISYRSLSSFNIFCLSQNFIKKMNFNIDYIIVP